MVVNERGSRDILENRGPGEHPVKHCANRVDVRACVQRCFPEDLLGRDVLERAEERPGFGESGAGILGLCDPEIEHLDVVTPAPVLDEHYVRGLHGAEDGSSGVCRAEAVADFARDREKRRERQPLITGQPRRKRFALQELHDEEKIAALGFADIEDLDDVGVPDLRRPLGLAYEASLGVGVLRVRAHAP